ncbi:Universal stress protein family protein [Halogranum gelatinilyticum]|uniref:Universal stress protein family protein n=1 Tax=Halogranum gelatinilyticum TaxID=660521 RepID=A0A1G9U734_9EURY|nr:HPP family protein [Halogranum gelatinilyticum]SDM55769.1 Universal stress protein family protein [Halogranum gelatinilyticum]
MRDRVRARLVALGRRLRRVERRELAEFGRWVETTDNLIHLTVLLLVPLLIAFVTELTTLTELSFLLFPPLASGTYTLFSDPRGKYASPRRFVGGLAVGALCGWGAQLVTMAVLPSVDPGTVHPLGAGLSILFTGGITWALDVEEPAAFSTALLVLVADTGQPVPLFGLLTVSQSAAYVFGVTVSGTIVAAVFALWRDRFYEERARYLYGSVQGDDHVLVPMRGETAGTTALFGAALAAAHEAGKVVLLDVVDDERLAAAEHALAAAHDEDSAVDGAELAELVEETADDPGDEAARLAAAESVADLERHAEAVRRRFDVPCEVVVASGDPAQVTIDTTRTANCDLVVTPYESEAGSLSPFVRSVFRGPTDAVAFRSTTAVDRWRRVLVTVARPGDSAHAMIDFGTRLAGDTGGVSVCTCIDSEAERRRAETQLANLVETVDGTIETRVARTDIQSFIDANARSYDLVILGSSGDRSAASRFISPPTFERLQDVECDVAVVDRGDL